jgi:hypothetical protein
MRRPTTLRGFVPATLVNVAMGVWLILSAFAWEHGDAQKTNTWICGLLTVVFSLSAFADPMIKYLNTLLAVWLLVSSWSLPTVSLGTFWNNGIVAIVIFCASLVPLEVGSHAPRP